MLPCPWLSAPPSPFGPRSPCSPAGFPQSQVGERSLGVAGRQRKARKQSKVRSSFMLLETVRFLGIVEYGITGVTTRCTVSPGSPVPRGSAFVLPLTCLSRFHFFVAAYILVTSGQLPLFLINAVPFLVSPVYLYAFPTTCNARFLHFNCSISVH